MTGSNRTDIISHIITDSHMYKQTITERFTFFKQEIGRKKEQGKFEYGHTCNVELYTLCGNQKMTM